LKQVSARNLNRLKKCNLQDMSGLLAEKEIEYLDQLIKRNRKLRLKSKGALSKPLHLPLTSAERQIRASIRHKVLAGMVDVLKIRVSGVDSVSEINNALQLLCDNSLSVEERRVRDAILEND